MPTDTATLVSGLRQAWPMPSTPRPITLLGAGGIVRDAHLPAYRALNAGFLAAEAPARCADWAVSPP